MTAKFAKLQFQCFIKQKSEPSIIGFILNFLIQPFSLNLSSSMDQWSVWKTNRLSMGAN